MTDIRTFSCDHPFGLRTAPLRRDSACRARRALVLHPSRSPPLGLRRWSLVCCCKLTLRASCARFAKRRTIFAVHVQKKVCGDCAANSACEMTAPAKVHLEASRALRPCFRNKRCPQSTAGGCSERFCSMLARSLGHRLAVSSNVTARFGLTLYELACADTKIVCVRSLAASGRAFGCADFGAGLCFFCAASSFYRLTECIEFNAVCSSALRSMC